MVGLDDLKGLFQPIRFCDSTARRAQGISAPWQQRAKNIWRCIVRSVAGQVRKVIARLYSALFRPHLEHCALKDIGHLKQVELGATEIVGLERRPCQQWLRDLTLRKSYWLTNKVHIKRPSTGLLIVGYWHEGGISVTLYIYLKGGCSKVGVGLFSQVTSDRTRGNGLKLRQGKFRLDIRKNFFTERVVKHWNRLPREVVESPPLEVFKRHVDVVLRDMV
ncbi:hypothetical protein QYF61_002651 [Mycteria americana]|uniref:Uncharacterized protein n=1 Tax=Mycteria americana TaxID=33587 RepID=A0AAN7NP98_MYCAM|nr:hypothetical protein QYF61_002651 [Mycteria americana]